MKITRTQLQKIIKEELEQAVQEGEIDEGWFDALKGGIGKVAGDVGTGVAGAGRAVGGAVAGAGRAVGGAVGGVVDSAKEYGKDVADTMSAASKKADIAKLQSQIQQLDAQKAMLQQKLTALAPQTASPAAVARVPRQPPVKRPIP